MTKQEHAAQAPRDTYGTTMKVLASVKEKANSAYKVALGLGIREHAAARVLKLAEEHGIVIADGTTRKGYPVYRWRGRHDWLR